MMYNEKKTKKRNARFVSQNFGEISAISDDSDDSLPFTALIQDDGIFCQSGFIVKTSLFSANMINEKRVVATITKEFRLSVLL